MENVKRTFSFKKEAKGTVVITLDPYDYSSPAKKFRIAHNVKQITVPHKFALGLFVSSGALAQLEMGYFSVEDYETLKLLAAEEGLYDGVDVPKIPTNDDVKNLIVAGKTEEINSLLSLNHKTINTKVIIAARENIDVINNATIKVIEDSLGVELRIE